MDMATHPGADSRRTSRSAICERLLAGKRSSHAAHDPTTRQRAQRLPQPSSLALLKIGSECRVKAPTATRHSRPPLSRMPVGLVGRRIETRRARYWQRLLRPSPQAGRASPGSMPRSLIIVVLPTLPPPGAGRASSARGLAGSRRERAYRLSEHKRTPPPTPSRAYRTVATRRTG
jgi:hypothetical protein